MIRLTVGLSFLELCQSLSAGGDNIGRVFVSSEQVPYTAPVERIVIDNENVQEVPLNRNNWICKAYSHLEDKNHL